MTNVFNKETSEGLIARVNNLTASTPNKWGKMNVVQMLAHCNVTYELAYEITHRKPTGIKKFILRKFVKPIVVGDKPYKKNGRTAPVFLIADEREFEKEKKRLIDYIEKTQKLGADFFDNRESHSFGKLTSKEWSNLFHKHIDHHLQQFGV